MIMLPNKKISYVNDKIFLQIQDNLKPENTRLLFTSKFCVRLKEKS